MNNLKTVLSLIACIVFAMPAFARTDTNTPIYMQCHAEVGTDGKPILTFTLAKQHSEFLLGEAVYLLEVRYTDGTENLRSLEPTFYKFTGRFADIRSVHLTAKPRYPEDFVSRFTGKTRKPRKGDSSFESIGLPIPGVWPITFDGLIHESVKLRGYKVDSEFEGPFKRGNVYEPKALKVEQSVEGTPQWLREGRAPPTEADAEKYAPVINCPAWMKDGREPSEVEFSRFLEDDNLPSWFKKELKVQNAFCKSQFDRAIPLAVRDAQGRAFLNDPTVPAWLMEHRKELVRILVRGAQDVLDKSNQAR